MRISIRKVARNDFDGVLSLNRSMYKEVSSNRDFGDWAFLKRPSRSNMLKWFKTLLAEAKKGNAIYLVANVDGQIAGHCFVRSEPPNSELAHVGVLSMLVRSDYRGKGIGGKLLDSAIKQSRGKFKILHLRVMATNEIAKKLYINRGFKCFGTAPRFYKRDTKYVDREYYYLNL